MLAEISAGLSSLKAAKDIVQGLSEAKTEAATNGVKIELQGLILEAQQGLFAAQEAQSGGARRIAELEQEIARLNDWSVERERYHLVDIYEGAVAYMLRAAMAEGTPAHWLCTNCFDQGRKSHLQPQGKVGTNTVHKCGACQSTVVIHMSITPTYPDA
jgi:hypothetical protein